MRDKGEIGVCGHNRFCSVPSPGHCSLDWKRSLAEGQGDGAVHCRPALVPSSPVQLRGEAPRRCDGFPMVSRRWGLFLLASCGPVALGSLNQGGNGQSSAEWSFFGNGAVL